MHEIKRSSFTNRLKRSKSPTGESDLLLICFIIAWHCQIKPGTNSFQLPAFITRVLLRLGPSLTVKISEKSVLSEDNENFYKIVKLQEQVRIFLTHTYVNTQYSSR